MHSGSDCRYAANRSSNRRSGGTLVYDSHTDLLMDLDLLMATCMGRRTSPNSSF